MCPHALFLQAQSRDVYKLQWNFKHSEICWFAAEELTYAHQSMVLKRLEKHSIYKLKLIPKKWTTLYM